jgi:hypothetical protein
MSTTKRMKVLAGCKYILFGIIRHGKGEERWTKHTSLRRGQTEACDATCRVRASIKFFFPSPINNCLIFDYV